MSVGLQISQEKNGDVQVIRIDGRLDAASAPKLEIPLNALIQGGEKKVLIDFAKVEYLSSAGMRLILSASKKMSANEGKLHFCFMSDEVMEIIKMAGFQKILSIYSTEKEALEKF